MGWNQSLAGGGGPPRENELSRLCRGGRGMGGSSLAGSALLGGCGEGIDASLSAGFAKPTRACCSASPGLPCAPVKPGTKGVGPRGAAGTGRGWLAAGLGRQGWEDEEEAWRRREAGAAPA